MANNFNYQRNVKELRQKASIFWPKEISQQEAELSLIPKLIETQEQFIAILSINICNLDGLFQIIDSSTLTSGLFTKHLIILADFGGEMLQRVNSQFQSIFPLGKLDYLWNSQNCCYQFRALPTPGKLNNVKLGIFEKTILDKQPLSDLQKDVIALLIFGGCSLNSENNTILSKCEIGNYIGQPDKIKNFIQQRYIWVSRITSGSQSNTLGQITQNFVKRYIEDNIDISVSVQTNSYLPGVRHSENLNKMTNFDIVVSNPDKNKYVAIEVSFQVTTNSVIERKAGQAKSRFEQIEKSGYKIAYVLDGAGNFQRETALQVICDYSHCTVAFTLPELNVLCDFLKKYFIS